MKRRGRYSCVDPRHPEAAGVCDRGGEVQKRRDLYPETRWAGGRLMPTGFLSCLRHMDEPNPQFGGHRPLRPDPVPVRDPRPPDGATRFPFAPVAEPMLYADGTPFIGVDGGPLLSLNSQLPPPGPSGPVDADVPHQKWKHL